jgi:hypothetical protein
MNSFYPPIEVMADYVPNLQDISESGSNQML